MMTHPLMGGESGEADASHGPMNLVVVSRCDDLWVVQISFDAMMLCAQRSSTRSVQHISLPRLIALNMPIIGTHVCVAGDAEQGPPSTAIEAHSYSKCAFVLAAASSRRPALSPACSEPATRSSLRSPRIQFICLCVSCSVVAASGFIAGLLGIGGALIFNPFLLALGVQPQVVASTAVSPGSHNLGQPIDVPAAAALPALMRRFGGAQQPYSRDLHHVGYGYVRNVHAAASIPMSASCVQVLIILFGSSSIALSFLFNHMLNVSYVKVTVNQSLQNCMRAPESLMCVPLLCSYRVSVRRHFTASAVTATTLTLSRLHISQVFAPIAFFSSLVGVTLIGWAVRKSGRARCAPHPGPCFALSLW